MARPRKPVELKKIEGTYRKDRDAEREKTDLLIQKRADVIFSEDTKVSCPKTIKTKYVKSYWKKLTSMLISIRVLSAADIPQLEQLCIVLEKLREIQEVWIKTTPFDEEYDLIEKRFITLSNKFDILGSKYFISPQARTKLTLDNLTAVKTEQDIKKNENAIDSLLNSRK